MLTLKPKEYSLAHAQTDSYLFEKLNTSKKGLEEKVVLEKRKEYGENVLPEAKKASPLILFLKQFKSPLVYVLILAAIISFLAHPEDLDHYIILVVIFINACIGFYEENKAEKAMQALKKMVVVKTKIYRGGEIVEVDSKELVPGDIIILEQGDMIPADCRLIETYNFRTVESSLTGESFPIDKNTKIMDKKTPMADRKNMVWMGTFAVNGEAKALVIGTGIRTFIGQLSERIGSVQSKPSHFEQKTNQLVKIMGGIAFLGAIVTFCIGYFLRDLAFSEIFIFSISVLVSGVPEGLPVVMAVVLSIGANRMAFKNAIVRHLSATENVGITTVIATDKTGTLTQNTMMVKKIYLPNGEEISVGGEGWEPKGEFYLNEKKIKPLENKSLKNLLKIACFGNNAHPTKKDGMYQIIGDPTEGALAVLTTKAGMLKEILEKEERKIEDMPFNPELKYRASLSVLVREKNKAKIYVVGAPEAVLSRSSKIDYNGKCIKLDANHTDEINQKIYEFGSQAMRVIGFGYLEVPKDTKELKDAMIKNLTFAGVVGMYDPPRHNVKKAISQAHKAGIRVIMKTGDHKETALAIAKEIGLIKKNQKPGKYPLGMSESELKELSEKELNEVVKEVNVYARLTPEMKYRLVELLQKQGEVVAMTGDGINDAPALKKADVGISMGLVGTDVAREASEIVLADDNFATIIDAIEEGRIIFTNMRQTSMHLTTTSIAEVVTIVGALAMGCPLPLLPIHVLWLNLVTEGTGDAALATEQGHGDMMQEPPRNKNEDILSFKQVPFILIIVGVMASLGLWLFTQYLSYGEEKARTVIFLFLVFSQLFNIWNFRSLKQSVFKIGFFSNRWIDLSILISIILVLIAVYLEPVRMIFKFTPVGLNEWFLIVSLSSFIWITGEIYKSIKRKYFKDFFGY